MADFRDHAAEAGGEYARLFGTYDDLVKAIRSVLHTCLSELPIHTIQGRAKDMKSFLKKAAKPSKEDPSQPKYPNPLDEITDLAGLRVITYFPDAIEAVERVLREELEIIERTDKSKKFDASGQLGYQSVHFLVRLKAPRTLLPEYSPFASLIAEIQVRTILQHAWAEMEHDIQYKSAEEIPTLIRRRFAALAGLIEIADREFQAIQDEDKRLRAEVIASLSSDPSSGEVDTQERPSTSEEWLAARGRYDELITRDPNQYAHYLGRAKTRFLAGDRTGALEDLDRAERVAPGHAHIAAVRRSIDEGVVANRSEALRLQRKYLDQGIAALSKGDADQAVRIFTEVIESGHATVYVFLDRALANALAGRYQEAKNDMARIRLIPGSFMAVNIAACRELLRADEEQRVDVASIESALRDLQEPFDILLSPVRHVEEAWCNKGASVSGLVAPIFAILRGRSRNEPKRP
jgi:ppGpp synthetase/RelA/SpoT-type nucleotidyltranferase